MRTSIWHWLAAGAALICASPGNAQGVQSGIEAWQRSDHVRAVEIWRPLAQAGDADAAFNLGQAYRLGRGVGVDLATAQVWLEQAARSGHMDAQTTLGLLLFENGNRAGGLRWLRQAADQSEPRAMLIYGTALFNGDGLPQDPVTAYAYVSRASAQGLGAAKATLEQMDQVLPLEQRRKGVALAMQQAKAAAPKSEAKAQPARPVVDPTLAKASAPRLGGGIKRWRVQLGAFSNRASAEALYKRLSSNAPVAGRQLHLLPAGAVTRLQVGPFESKAAASAACKALSARGQACFPVGPK